MRNGTGFTLTEVLVVIIIVGILAAVTIPIMHGRIDSAKWSEGKAIMGAIARALRAHVAEEGVNFSPVPTLEQLGFGPDDINCTYFSCGESGSGNFSWVVNSREPLDFLITATAPEGIGSPSQITLDQAGKFTEIP